ncbi:N-6 DNA methylase [Priestia megaterium]|uniref:N-6 DNA methylase n=1 Tax=Priestia megaterium TaxID=1404 RepID=UPI002FFD6BEE
MENYYYSFFDDLRGEVHEDEYLQYFLLNETVKKVTFTNNFSLLETWEEVLASSDPETGLIEFFNRYGLNKLVAFLDSSNLNKRAVKVLADFSNKNRKEPLINEIQFLEIYERILSSRGQSAGLGISNSLFKLMHLLAGTKNASSIYDGTLYQVNNLISAHLINPEVKIYAETPYRKERLIVEMISYLYLENKAQVEQSNVLLQPRFTKTTYDLMKFESIVMAPPIGIQIKEDYIKHDLFGRFTYGSISKRDSTFGFIAHAISSMEEKGRAVMLVLGAPLFRTGKEEEVRQALLEQDLIEGVIQLPAFILFGTGVAPFLIILNKTKNSSNKGKVKFLDASEAFTQEGRRKILKDDNVDFIVKEYFENKTTSDICKEVPIEEIVSNASNLVPDKYFLKEIIEIPGFGNVKIDETEWIYMEKVTLEKVANITNGVNIKANEQGKTIKIIKAGDIQDGELMIEQIEGQSVEWKDTYEKGIVQPGDLLMLSRGSASKMAVMPETDEELIASTNLMIIRPKEGMNPYFLKLYLESPFGQLELAKVQTGGTIFMWPLKEVKKIQIPFVSIEEQHLVSDKYTEANRIYKETLIKAKEDLEQAQLEIYQQLGLFSKVSKINI